MDKEILKQATLISETDIYGTIIFANDDFCKISQYAAEELLGKPHNIIRHPDMPGGLFKLLWDTIKKGEVFRGIIKNRARDGTHYWVSATIMPVFDANNKIVKFIGARYHLPDDAQAQRLFNEQAKRLKIG